MTSRPDIYPDLSKLIVAALGRRHDAPFYAARIVSALGLGEDGTDAEAEAALRESLRLPGLSGADLATARLILTDALDYRREHEDAECADCERGDCPVTTEDARRMRAYLIFAAKLGTGSEAATAAGTESGQ